MPTKDRTRALLMTAAMLLASLAGCLEDGTPIDDDDIMPTNPPEPADPVTNQTDDGGEDDEGSVTVAENETNTTTPDPLSVTLTVGSGESWDSIQAHVNISGGAPGQITVNWTVDGVALSTHGLSIMLENQSAGAHQVNVSVSDSEGTSIERGFELTLVRNNTAPTIFISLPSDAIAGDSVAWSVVASDPEGDPITTVMDFGDGAYANDTIEGHHVWSAAGLYNITATVRDSYGLMQTHTVGIQIVGNDAPSLVVEASPSSEGMSFLLTETNDRNGDPISITATATDPNGQALNLTVDWGDGATEPLVSGVTETHLYETAGAFEVVVLATDSAGLSTAWKMDVEALDSLDESMVFTLQEESLPDGDEAALELDADGDGVVDEAADAENESGYDWETVFDPDGDGDADHDNERDSWQQRGQGDIRSVAESDDTSARSEHEEGEGHDSLISYTEHITDEETESEREENLTDVEGVMDDLFEDEQPLVDEMLEDDRLDEQRFQLLANSVHSFWWNETYTADFNSDGTAESACNQLTILYWLDVDRDANPERAALLRVRQCQGDFDGDGKTDAQMEEMWGLNYTDFNSDGDAEILHAIHASTIIWDNETVDPATGMKYPMADTNQEIAWVIIEDMDDDGNAEELRIATAHTRSIDIGKDHIIEAEWIEVGGIALDDDDDDGNADSFAAIEIEGFDIDLDGDGNANQSMHVVRLFRVDDTDHDGNANVIVAVEHGGWEFDNNSDGRADTVHNSWLGVRMDDRNADGTIDKVATLHGYEERTDDDANGVPEVRAHWILASVVKDLDADGNPEHAWVIAIHEHNIDSDQDGLWDWKNGSFAGAVARDADSDGHAESYVGMVIHGTENNEQAIGYESSGSRMWLLSWQDKNDDGTSDHIHALQVQTRTWDNDTDGDDDTVHISVQGIDILDRDYDGQEDRVVWWNTANVVTDDDADDEVEYSLATQTFHARNYTSTGAVEAEYLYHVQFLRANISANDVAQYENTTIFAYQTVDDSQDSYTHAFYLVTDSIDIDRDGTKETETVHVHEDNRS